MKQKNRIVLAVAFVIVVAVLIASYCMYPNESGKAGAHSFPQPIEAGDMDYPTAAEAREEYDAILVTLSESLSDETLDADAMGKAIDSAYRGYNRLNDDSVWFVLDYNCDPNGKEGEYQAWSVLTREASYDLAVVIGGALGGPCAGTVEKALESFGLDPDAYRSYSAMADEAKILREMESELVSEYYEVIGTEYSVTDSEGNVWTTSSVYGSTALTAEEKSDLIKKINNEQLADVAEIFVELVEVRNDYAVLNGYSNYAEYAYEVVYGKEYTPSVVESFSEIGGKANWLNRNMYGLSGYTYEMRDEKLSWFYDLDTDSLIDTVEPFIDSVDSDFAKLLDYMTEYGLIRICDDEGRVETIASMPISERGSAVIYNGMTGLGDMTIDYLLQMFGTAANKCLTADGTSCYDVDVLFSVGLNSLYCSSGYVGNGSDEALAIQYLDNYTYWISLSAVLTELEVWCYETDAKDGPLTVDQVCDKFEEILDSSESWFYSTCDLRYFWAYISDVVVTPLYYSNCYTSSINAIELYLEAIDDYDSAKEKYLSLLNQEGVDGYAAAVKKAGLTNALDTEASMKILEDLEKVFREMGARE